MRRAQILHKEGGFTVAALEVSSYRPLPFIEYLSTLLESEGETCILPPRLAGIAIHSWYPMYLHRIRILRRCASYPSINVNKIWNLDLKTGLADIHTGQFSVLTILNVGRLGCRQRRILLDNHYFNHANGTRFKAHYSQERSIRRG